MKLTVLGSGSLIPVPQRGNSGYFLETKEHTCLLDGGSGTLRRIADFGLNYRSIDTLLYTHLHPDHTFDLVPLLFAFRHDPAIPTPGSLRIIGPPTFKTHFDQLMEIYGEWVLPEKIELNFQEVFRDTVTLEDVEIIANHTEHTEQSVTYRIVDRGGRDLFYSGDTDLCDELIESARGVDLLLLECSRPDDKKAKGHLTPSECGKIAAEVGCEHLVLTHFYPDVLETDIIASVSKHYEGKVDLAYDGMQIEV